MLRVKTAKKVAKL